MRESTRSAAGCGESLRSTTSSRLTRGHLPWTCTKYDKYRKALDDEKFRTGQGDLVYRILNRREMIDDLRREWQRRKEKGVDSPVVVQTFYRLYTGLDHGTAVLKLDEMPKVTFPAVAFDLCVPPDHVLALRQLTANVNRIAINTSYIAAQARKWELSAMAYRRVVEATMDAKHFSTKQHKEPHPARELLMC